MAKLIPQLLEDVVNPSRDIIIKNLVELLDPEAQDIETIEDEAMLKTMWNSKRWGPYCKIVLFKETGEVFYDHIPSPLENTKSETKGNGLRDETSSPKNV